MKTTIITIITFVVLLWFAPFKEEVVHRVFTQQKLYYPVGISYADESPLDGFPYLKPADFLRTMALHNDLGHILGGFNTMAEAKGMLLTFWGRYKKVFPKFQLFEEVTAGLKQLEQCIPLYLHGDEGVTYKKRGVLIMSFQSPLGFGTSRRPQEMSLNLENMGESGLPLNFLKCGMYTRMLMVLCPKEYLWVCCQYTLYNVWNLFAHIIGLFVMHDSYTLYMAKPCEDMYKDDIRVWNAIMKIIASEFQVLERDGIDLGRNGTVYPVILGMKGDWSFLATWMTLATSIYFQHPFPWNIFIYCDSLSHVP